MTHWTEDIPIIALDFETTGLDTQRCSPVSIGALLRDGRSRMRPVADVPEHVRPDTPVEPGAYAVHGISNDQAARGAPLGEGLSALLRTLNDVRERGGMVAGANLSYDLSVLLYAGHRCGLPNVDAVIGRLHCLDAMVLDRGLDTIRQGRRSLTDLCEHYGVRLQEAHRARADAQAALGVGLSLLRRTELPDGELGPLASHPPSADRLAQLRTADTPALLHRLQQRWWSEGLSWLRAHRRRSGGSFVGETSWPVGAWQEPVGDGWAYAERWARGQERKFSDPGTGLQEDLARAFEEGRAAERARIAGSRDS